MSNQPLLEVDHVEAVYDGIRLALRGVSLSVTQGQITVLLGSNGAGKTSTLRAISNLLPAELGAVTSGAIRYEGRDITHTDPADLVRGGLVQVLEGRHCFAQLTVEENLLMGAASLRGSRRSFAPQLERIYEAFPRLYTRRSSKAGYTSGGEQQMIAIGRALMAKPRLILLDEPSMGLAPQIVEEIFEFVRALNRTAGVSFLIAEQNAALALAYADYAYVIENGRVPSHGPAAELAAQNGIQALYLGGDVADQTLPIHTALP
jgi:branched-chain amino acid transport system ATP-binding protein